MPASVDKRLGLVALVGAGLAGLGGVIVSIVTKRSRKRANPVARTDPDEQGVAQLLDVLRRVGYRDGAAKQWWHHVVQPELEGRTAERAWLEGDRQPVKGLVESLASRRLADALSDSPGPVEQLLKSASSQ